MEEKLFIEHLSACLSKFKEAKIAHSVKPEELRLIFDKALITKNDYWEINKDSNKLTKLGLIFKPSKANIKKGKPIYVALLFNSNNLNILLEEQYARTEANTFKLDYDLIFNDWKSFEEKLKCAFITANNLANGLKYSQ